MDFDEMRDAYARAMGQIPTKATGSHIPTIVVESTPAPAVSSFAEDLVCRLMDHHQVTKDALSREAALTLKYEHQQLQLNLARLDGAIQIMSDLYANISELGGYSRNWPWDSRENGADEKLNSALDACQGFMKACWPWTA